MFKKFILILISFGKVLAPDNSYFNHQLQTNVLAQILEDVKKNRFKSDGLVDVEFEIIDSQVKKLNDLELHIKEVQKSLKTGMEVLNKVNENLSSEEAKKNSNFKKAQPAVKTAQQEHTKVLKIVENIKTKIKNDLKQIEDQVKKLNEALKPLNEKSKVAIEKAQPILQSIAPKRKMIIPLD